MGSNVTVKYLQTTAPDDVVWLGHAPRIKLRPGQVPAHRLTWSSAMDLEGCDYADLIRMIDALNPPVAIFLDTCFVTGPELPDSFLRCSQSWKIG